MRILFATAVVMSGLLLACMEETGGPVPVHAYACPDSCVIQVIRAIQGSDTTWGAVTVGRWVLDTIALRAILDANGLTTLPCWAVVGSAGVDTCGRILTLDLSGRSISCLPDTVTTLTELRELDLYNNRGIDSLPSAIGRLANLATLMVQRCSLTRLPDSLCNLSALRTLYVHDNLLTRLPDSLGRLSALTTLELGANELDSLPQSITRLSSLSTAHFVVGGNHLCGVPDGIADWLTAHSYEGNQWQSSQSDCDLLAADTAAVRALLDSNGLASTPVCSVAVIRAGRVGHLNLAARGLTAFPPGIFRLTGLQSLDLSANAIASVPDGIGSLRQLTRLDLSANRLSALPLGLDSLGDLDTLLVSGNHLADDSIVNWRLPPGLVVLDLSHNPLVALGAEVGKLSSLARLDVSSDSLTSLPPLDSLTRLRVLDASGNRLTTLPPSIGRLLAMDTLDVGTNVLNALPTQVSDLVDCVVVATGNKLCTGLPSVVVDWLNRHAVEPNWSLVQVCP
jgi:Leucine-rich repeat (LRR) protein